MRDTYIDSNLNPITKFTSSNRSTEFAPMEHLSNDREDHPNQQNNSHKLCNETGHPIVRLTESQWKLKRKHDQQFPMEGKPVIVEQILASEKINKSKIAGL